MPAKKSPAKSATKATKKATRKPARKPAAPARGGSRSKSPAKKAATRASRAARAVAARSGSKPSRPASLARDLDTEVIQMPSMEVMLGDETQGEPEAIVDDSAPVAIPGAKFKASDPAAVLEFAIDCARLVRDDKCEDVVLLDTRGLSSVADFIIIGSGTSDRQMRSVLHHVEDLGATRGFRAFRVSADDRAAWLLADFVDVVVHLFEPNTRAHYDLEMLWGDAKRLDWERPDQRERNRAGI